MLYINQAKLINLVAWNVDLTTSVLHKPWVLKLWLVLRVLDKDGFWREAAHCEEFNSVEQSKQGQWRVLLIIYLLLDLF